MTSPRSRIAFLLGAGANWLAFAATLAVAFFLTPFLIAALGKPRYDVWCVVEAVLAYLTLLDMGVAACLVRYVAKHHATADRDGLNRIASSCLVVFLAAGGAALVVGVPVLFGLSGTLVEKADGDAGVMPFMLLMLVNLAITLPLGVFPSVLDGLERYTIKSVIKIAALAVRTGGVVFVVLTYGGLFPLAVVYLATTLLEHAAMAAAAFRLLPGLRFARRSIDRETLKQVKTYSVDAFLAMLAGRVTVQTGGIVIGLLLPAGGVTFYATAARLVEYAKTLLRTVTATLTPNVAAMEARGDHAGIARLFLNATRWMLYLVLPVHVGLLLFGRPFLERWVGVEFVAGSYPALVLLSLTLTIGVAQSVASRILYGLGRLKWFARAALIEAGLNVVLMIALIGPFGVSGVATAVAIPNVLFCLFVTGLAAKQLGVGVGDYVRAWVKPVLLTLVPVTVWLLLGEATPDYAAIGWRVAVGLMPYTIAVGGLEFGRTVWNKLSGAKLGVPASADGR